MKKNLLLMASSIGVGLTVQLASAEVVSSNLAPVIELENWTLQPLGLTDAEHTREDGFRLSELGYYYYQKGFFNEAGQAVGISNRYDGDTGVGRSTWLYSSSETQRIGLLDSDHSSGNDSLEGRIYSEPRSLNQAGQVTGISHRYDQSGVKTGQSAWVFNGNETLRVGLIDEEHTHTDGRQYSEPNLNGINAEGQAIGFSVRYVGSSAENPPSEYSGSTKAGESAWFYDGSKTHRVGFYDTEYTGEDDRQFSTAKYISDAGRVAGTSSKYRGSISGQIAWAFEGGQTRRIGIIDAVHTKDNGFHNSRLMGMNKSGAIIGSSWRFANNTFIGESAWIYDGNQTSPIGLFVGEDIEVPNGVIQQFINEAGQVAGRDDRGVWLYSKGETALIRKPGLTSKKIFGFNEAGQVLGGGAGTVWLYTGKETRELGFYDRAHIDWDDNYQADLPTNAANLINNMGQVVGSSKRFDENGVFMFKRYWLYDPSTDTLHDIIPQPLGSQPEVPYTEVEIQHFTDDGLVLGYYKIFPGWNMPYYRAFIFSIKQGFKAVTSELGEGDLDELDWSHLATASLSNKSGQIIGSSWTNEKTKGAYLLIPKQDGDGNGFPSVAITSPISSSELFEGSSVTFTVDASDSDGSVTKVEYYAFGDQLFATSTEAPFSITVDRAPYGTFDITAVAYDNDGNSTTSEVVTLTVNANDGGNIPPSITITSPSDNSELIEGATVTFTVDASDADGSVTKVEYYAFGDQLFGTVTEAPFTLNVDRAPYGRFDITAVVYDDEGASTVSPAIVVNVVEPTVVVD